MKRTFTLGQVLDLLVSMDQAIAPTQYESSKNLDTVDFFDLAVCKAQQLGLETEFNAAREAYAAGEKNLLDLASAAGEPEDGVSTADLGSALLDAIGCEPEDVKEIESNCGTTWITLADGRTFSFTVIECEKEDDNG